MADKIKKLSEAIRLGATFRPQCRYALFRDGMSCVQGQAYVALTGILLIAFFITDCSTGRTTHDEATVNGRYYKPPWTETTMKIEDHNAGKTFYFSLTNGQFVTIRSKQGRWTGIKYLGTIEP